MIGLILGIAALTAFITVVVKLTLMAMNWFKNKIKEKLRKRNAQKVAAVDLEEIINSTDNQISLDAFEKIADEGATHLFAAVDNEGNVMDVEAVGAKEVDEDVKSLINRTREGVVVVSAWKVSIKINNRW